MSLDPALCADGCGTPADRERPTSDGHTEKVCARHAEPLDDLVGALQKAVAAARARRLGEHSSNPREDG